MFASTNTVRPSNDFAAIAYANMSRHELVADVEGLADAMLHLVACEVLYGFADDGLDFVDQKRSRRQAFHCRGGRFGGDVGNRKRRECERSDCDFDHAQLRQLERKATRLTIEEGIAEFYSGDFRNSDDSRKRRGKRGGANRSRRQLPSVATTAGVDQFVEQGRTGHVVAVTVLPANCSRLQRKKALASIGRTLPKLDSASIRARMGLA